MRLLPQRNEESPQRSEETGVSQKTTAECVELGKSVVSSRKNGDVYGALLAIGPLMRTWSPLGLPQQEIIKMLGDPDQLQPNGMTYRLDTARSGWIWTFELKNGVVSKVTKTSLE